MSWLADMYAKDNIALRAQVKALREALRITEWAYDGEENPRFCPACHGREPEHHPTCKLPGLLREEQT